MAKTWKNAPSPCIDVCKYKNEGRCIGCTMTKADKKRFVRLEGKAQKKAFFGELVARLAASRSLPFWEKAYRKKCAKRGVPCPLDKLTLSEEA